LQQVIKVLLVAGLQKKGGDEERRPAAAVNGIYTQLARKGGEL
jgi:hypothetical protein